MHKKSWYMYFEYYRMRLNNGWVKEQERCCTCLESSANGKVVSATFLAWDYRIEHVYNDFLDLSWFKFRWRWLNPVPGFPGCLWPSLFPLHIASLVFHLHAESLPDKHIFALNKKIVWAHNVVPTKKTYQQQWSNIFNGGVVTVPSG